MPAELPPSLVSKLPACPLPGAHARRATVADANELMVLQRCCWVDEAIANRTLDIAALTESLDEVTAWIDAWHTWVVRLDGRLIGAVRAQLRSPQVWEIGRLMVAPDMAHRGLGRWLLALAEASAPTGVTSFWLFTGRDSARNQTMYIRAGYVLTGDPAPPSAVALAKPVRPPAV